jgi:hypothetical protein
MLRGFQLRGTESEIPATPSLGESGRKRFNPCEAQQGALRLTPGEALRDFWKWGIHHFLKSVKS